MFHVRQENLPFVGSSHEFVGAERQRNTSILPGTPVEPVKPSRPKLDTFRKLAVGRFRALLSHIVPRTPRTPLGTPIGVLKDYYVRNPPSLLSNSRQHRE